MAQAFAAAVKNPFPNGSAIEVADEAPITFLQLANFISQTIHHNDYPKWKQVPAFLFKIAGKLAAVLGQKSLQTSFFFFAGNWFYNVQPLQKMLKSQLPSTLSTFKKTILSYKKLKEKKHGRNH